MRIALGLALLIVLPLNTPAPVVPVPSSVTEAPEPGTTANAGLFFAVNRFFNYESDQNLPFSINNAVSQAASFSLALRLIPPQNVFLVLSGEPTGTNVFLLQKLKELGANVKETATKGDFFWALKQVRKKADAADGFVVVSLSAHGSEDSRGRVFVDPQDAVERESEASISIEVVRSRLDAFKARKRLLLLDACRSKSSFEGSTLEGLSAPYYRTLSQSRGTLIVTSSSSGELSWQLPSLQAGTFSAVLVEALSIAADEGRSDFRTLGDAIDFTVKTVPLRSVALHPNQVRQTPWRNPKSFADEVEIGRSPKFAARRTLKQNILRLIEGSSLSLTEKSTIIAFVDGANDDEVATMQNIVNGTSAAKRLEGLRSLCALKAPSNNETAVQYRVRGHHISRKQNASISEGYTK